MRVLAFLCSLLFILYLDRVCISQAIVAIQDEFILSNRQVGMILLAFTLAYGLFEVPTGYWGDRFGSRIVLTRIAVWWSIFTVLTAFCIGFYSLLTVRFLFGAGEAGAFPNSARIVARWFPARERGRVQGFVLASAMIGGTVAPVITGYLIDFGGWRLAFVLFGGLGVVWAIAFASWFRDDPAQHPAVNDAERRLLDDNSEMFAQHHDSIPWRAALRHRSVWLLGTITACGAFMSYLYYSWYAKYLQAARGADLVEAGWLASLVLGGGLCGTLLGGLVADRFPQNGPVRMRWMRFYCCGCFLLSGICLLLSVLTNSLPLSGILACASCLLMSCQQSSWWSCVNELGGRHLGTLFGLMNSLGLPGAMASQYFFGASADWRETLGYAGRAQWDPAFAVYICLLWVAAFCWLFVDSTHPILSEAEPDTILSASSSSPEEDREFCGAS
ncbi:MFS transporter [Planctomicrobium sp. SH664]|uniref:MFS transporter n=1 Tax=Planctomicrobium sp. SH664 TaxID=3448125 RepID=UPI003F5B43EF